MQSLRELVFSTLTVPLIGYNIDGGATAYVPAANVKPQASWQEQRTPPMPGIFYAVKREKATSAHLPGEGNFAVKIWVVSAKSEDETVQIHAQAFDRFNYADQAHPERDLSRVASGTVYGISIREFVELQTLPALFEKETSRWYTSTEFHVAAI
jgi:hypothetical protein